MKFLILLWIYYWFIFTSISAQEGPADVVYEDFENQKPITAQNGEWDPQVPTLSVGNVFINSSEELKEYRRKHNVFILGVSNSSWAEWCQSELVLKQFIQYFENGKLYYKDKSVPVVRVDINKVQNLVEKEKINYDKLPTVYIYANKGYFNYIELFNFNFFLTFVNRRLHPVIGLSSDTEINLFLNATQEWTEKTPFYKEKYYSIEEFFPYFK